MKIYFAALAAAATLVGATAATATPAVTLTTDGANYPGTPYTLGFEFFVGSTQTITALGVYDQGADGLGNAATVGLWDLAGNLLASVVVPAGTVGTLDGTFRYSAITPFTLTAGQDYVVGSYLPNDLASSLGTGQGGTGFVNPAVTIVQDRFSNFNAAFSFPDTTNNFAGGAWLGGNFEFGPSGVPEPAAWAMMLIGFAATGVAVRRRARTASLAA